MSITVSLDQVHDDIVRCIKARLTPMLWGSPGI